MRVSALVILTLVATVSACSAQQNDVPPPEKGHADVAAVEVEGDVGDYTFSVTIESPDTGCEQYANWWEVVSPDGSRLIYRRILAHSHTDQQPFTRSGGPVVIAPDSTVVVRAHMNTVGYGGQALRGTPAGGFSAVDLPDDFGDEIDEASPDCAF
jgi:hypothetical protein